MKKGSYNILVKLLYKKQVAVRSRPLSQKEKEFSDFEIVKILDKKMVILIDPYEYNAPTDVFKNRSREQQYAFDFAFDKNCRYFKQINKIEFFLIFEANRKYLTLLQNFYQMGSLTAIMQRCSLTGRPEQEKHIRIILYNYYLYFINKVCLVMKKKKE